MHIRQSGQTDPANLVIGKRLGVGRYFGNAATAQFEAHVMAPTL
jgi:hypothetical protein